MISSPIGFITLLLVAAKANAFTFQSTHHPKVSFSPLTLTATSSSSDVSASKKATLTEETNWKLRFVMKNVPTVQKNVVKELLFVVDAQFVEEEGYEPPQGTVRQIQMDSESDDDSNKLKIVSSRWQLSEDPEDRKDGLWIWGLFKEPLYPFMLLQLETSSIPVPGSNTNTNTNTNTSSDEEEDKEKDSIGPLKLFAQISHSRDEKLGVVLKASVLNIREMETVKADILGAATVDVYEEVSVGQLNIQPV